MKPSMPQARHLGARLPGAISAGYSVVAALNALLGIVTTDLRAVAICASQDMLRATFFFESPISDAQRDEVEIATTEMSESLLQDTLIVVSDSTQPISTQDLLVFLRAGEKPLNNPESLVAHLSSGPFDWGDGMIVVGQALLGRVPPYLRGVTFNIEQDVFELTLFYDGQLSSDRSADLEAISSQVGSLLPPHFRLQSDILRIDYPKPIPCRGRIAFLRKEDIEPRKQWISVKNWREHPL